MQGNGSGRRLMTEINVTPFVDVMLVLLIIFMVTAPLMVQGVDVDLPRVAAPNIPAEEERLIVSIDGKGKVYINESAVEMGVLQPKLKALYRDRADRGGVFLKADENLPYGLVMRVMGSIRRAGVTRIGMVTSPSGDSSPDSSGD